MATRESTTTNMGDMVVVGADSSTLSTLSQRFGHVINIKDDYGATGDGVTNDYTVINSAVSAAVSAGKALYVPPGTYVIGTNLTIAPDVIFAQGAAFSPSTGIDVTFNGGIHAGQYQIFTGAGDCIFGVTYSGAAHPHWFGAVVDGSTDDSAALQSCFDNWDFSQGNTEQSFHIILPRGSMRCTSAISIDRDPETANYLVEGHGMSSNLLFDNGTDGFNFVSGNPQFTIFRQFFMEGDNSTADVYAFNFQEGSGQMVFENLRIGAFYYCWNVEAMVLTVWREIRARTINDNGSAIFHMAPDDTVLDYSNNGRCYDCTFQGNNGALFKFEYDDTHSGANSWELHRCEIQMVGGGVNELIYVNFPHFKMVDCGFENSTCNNLVYLDSSDVHFASNTTFDSCIFQGTNSGAKVYIDKNGAQRPLNTLLINCDAGTSSTDLLEDTAGSRTCVINCIGDVIDSGASNMITIGNYGDSEGPYSFMKRSFNSSDNIGKAMSLGTAEVDGTTWERVAMVSTSNATPDTLWSETLDDNTVYMFNVDIIAWNDTDDNEKAAYSRRMVAYRQGAGSATALVAEETIGTDGEDDSNWDAALGVSSNDAVITVTGVASTTIKWFAYIRYHKIGTD